MTRVYRIGNRRVSVTVVSTEKRAEPTARELDTMLIPVMRREERRGTADSLSLEELTSMLAFVGNSGGKISALKFLEES